MSVIGPVQSRYREAVVISVFNKEQRWKLLLLLLQIFSVDRFLALGVAVNIIYR